MSRQPAPWHDVEPLAHAFLDAAPSQCMWATDWPHTQCDGISDDDLLAALRTWCPDDDARNTVLRETPLRLYKGVPAR
jgi:predicted TIM-barrel fold metal-dependent hydrolase